MNKWDQIIKDIDEYNSRDPNREVFEDKMINCEVVYSIRVTRWVQRLVDSPSSELLVAARGAHIGRWEVPRKGYPEGLKGYYEWKTFLLKYHAEKVIEILELYKIDPITITAITNIITRKNLKENSDAQALEDAVCLVFLEIQLLPLMAKTTEDKVINAIQKTWKKMSLRGQEMALSIDLPNEAKQLIKKALEHCS